MNNNTREDLKAFINAVELLTHAVSSVAGMDAVETVFKTAMQLKKQLDSDETILP